MTEADTITERAGIVVWHLCHGESLQTRDVATLTGLTWEGARQLMVRLSRVVPVYQDEQGYWQVCALRELECAGVRVN